MYKRTIKNSLLFLPRVLWFLISFPIVFAIMWRIPEKIRDKDWHGLLVKAIRLHKIGFHTQSTWYWHALAYANLGKWTDALKCFETIAKPLEIEDEPYRWCMHAYVLAKLGRLTEGQTLLINKNFLNWPNYLKDWADNFLLGFSEKP